MQTVIRHGRISELIEIMLRFFGMDEQNHSFVFVIIWIIIFYSRFPLSDSEFDFDNRKFAKRTREISQYILDLLLLSVKLRTSNSSTVF